MTKIASVEDSATIGSRRSGRRSSSPTSGAGSFELSRKPRYECIITNAKRRLPVPFTKVRKSPLIGRRFDRHQAEQAVLSDSLDLVAAAVFLIDSNGSVCFGNQRAEAMFDEGKILRRGSQGFSSIDPAANKELQSILRGTRNGEVSHRALRKVVMLDGQGEHWLAHVLPLIGARPVMNYPAVAAVFVRKVAFDIGSPLEIVAKICKLTAMEIRVLQTLIEIGGSPSIANALGISETTVRTHIKGLFDKTGARRQADLIKLIAAHVSPAVDS